MVTRLRRLTHERPHAPALIVVKSEGDNVTEHLLTYEGFERRVRSLARLLQERFPKGERVLLLLDNDDHYLVSFFACLYAGLIAVPAFPPETVRERHLARLLAIAGDAQARCAMTTRTLSSLVRTEDFPGVSVIAVDEVASDGAESCVPHQPTIDDIAFLQYTSGSTSTPKGVMVSHANIAANSLAITEGLGMTADDVMATWLPLYHDMGLIGGVLQCFHNGVPIVLMSPKFFLERPVRWLEMLARHRATVSGGPDFAFRLCVERVRESQLRGLDLSHVRMLFSGSEPVRRDTLEDFVAHLAPTGLQANAVYPCYGLAEATLFVTGGRRYDGMTVREFSTAALAQGSPRESTGEAGGISALVACGRPATNHDVAILPPSADAATTPCGNGEVGEIWATGPSIACGYWQRPVESGATFVEREGRRWLRTGDLGFMHDGQLYIAGRCKDLIIVRGQNIYPQDVEQLVEAEVDAVRKGRVAAFSIDAKEGERIGIAVEISRSMQKLAPPMALVGALNETIATVCGEAAAVVVLLNPGALPKTSSGKLQRAACRQGWRERSLEAYAIYEFGEFVSGGERTAQAGSEDWSETETVLRALWRDAIGSPVDSRAANFFACGGNSLSAVRTAAEISAQWKINFPIRALFDHPKLTDCAAEIERLRAAESGDTFIEIPRLPAGQRQAALPLSHAQQRLWFLWRMEPESTAYHLAAAFRLDGEIDMAALQFAFDTLVARHESLRTVFPADAAGRPTQRILAACAMKLESHDLRGAAVDELSATAQAFAFRRFELAQGPLLRAAWLRTEASAGLLVIAMHHIVSDGASVRVFFDELTAAYRARIEGRIESFSELPLQYADYASWQRDWLAAGAGTRQLEYWRRALCADLPESGHPVLALPSDRPRRAVATYRAARLPFVLPEDLAKRARAFAQARGATLFTALLTAFSAALYRHTGQTDIRIGVPVANRNRKESAGLIGFFVNTLVLRSRPCGRLDLEGCFSQVRDSLLGAQDNQDLPFEQLVEALQPERSLSHNPLVQVTANHLQRNYCVLDGLTGKPAQVYPLPDPAAQFELTLETIEETDGAIETALVYAEELFEPATMARFAEHFLRVLESLVRHPQQAIGDIDLMNEPDLARLSTWGAPGAETPAFVPAHVRFETLAATHPDNAALIFGADSISYAELNRRANRLAHAMIAAGLGAEQRVGIALGRSPDLIVALLATLKTSAAYVPLDPAYPAERLAYMVADSGIRMLLTHSDLPNMPAAVDVAVFRLDIDPWVDMPETNPACVVQEAQAAYVIYTSGSTGRPKGVVVAHAPLAMHIAAVSDVYAVEPGNRELLFFSMNFDAAVEQWLTPLCGGAAIVLADEANLDARHVAELVERHRITTLHLPPAYLRLLAPLFVGKPSSIKVCIVGGEAWSAVDYADARAAFPGARLVNAYGPTETVITPTAWVGAAASAGGAYAPIGKPVGARSAYVLDADLNLVPPGSEGELYIGGAGLARSYLGRPGLSAERFVADPFGADGGRLYRTGDLVRWRADGELEYLGRLDHQIKVRGFRIEIGEIETMLQAQAGVREAVVVAHETAAGARLAAYVASCEGCVLEAAQLKAALAAALPDYMLPSAIVVLDALPLNPNGKVDRKALPAADLVTVQQYVPPTEGLEKTVAQVWTEALEVPQVGRDDNFFDLGGHSLLLIAVQNRLETMLQRRIAILDLFKHPTVGALARHLASASDAHVGADAQRHRERAQKQRRAFIQPRQTAGRTPA
ncbi:MAG TPA: amino acid adenylation domain-containing protein [Rhodocyclaceae bacterium]|nr:amino acid adenylation domain-containing protein [Rhodocyclaceae bacterium]